MVSAAIVTLTGDTNYGNRLQNYALQQVLRSMGADRVVTLEEVPRSEPRPAKAQRLASTAFRRRGELRKRLLLGRAAERVHDTHYVSPAVKAALAEFTRKYIDAVPYAEPEVLAERYDHFVAGSDQIWNPAFTHGNPAWFLSFASQEKRMAYAGSFGVPTIPRYLKRRFRNGLRGFATLSVRENGAADIVEELTGSRPPVVLDPTMLLPVVEWQRLMESASRRIDNQDYIAEILLSRGDTGVATTIHNHEIARVASAFSVGTVNVHDFMDAGGFGPPEFLRFIGNSTAVVTDSFHAAVFATLFHKPYFILPRGQMNSRFETLLDLTGIGDRDLKQLPNERLKRAANWQQVDANIRRCQETSTATLSDMMATHELP